MLLTTARRAQRMTTALGVQPHARHVWRASTSLTRRRATSFTHAKIFRWASTAVLVLLRALVSDQRAANAGRACDVLDALFRLTIACETTNVGILPTLRRASVPYSSLLSPFLTSSVLTPDPDTNSH